MNNDSKNSLSIDSYRQSKDIPTVRKVNEYNAYVMWNSIPATYRGLATEELEQLGVPIQFHELMTIRNHTEFSDTYGVGLNTLREWRRLPNFDADLVNTVDKDIFIQFYARVAREFTLKTIEYGDAQRFAMWMNKFAGHVERFAAAPIDNNSEEQEVILPDEGTNIMKLVLSDIAREKGMTKKDMDDLMSEVTDVDIIEETDLPSQQIYDFDKIAKIHEAKKLQQQAKEAAQPTNGTTPEQKEVKRIKIVKSVQQVANNGIKVKPTAKTTVKKTTAKRKITVKKTQPKKGKK